MSFWCTKFFQKTNLKLSMFALAYLGRNFSFVFWKDWKNKKRHFEINWPLLWNINLCYIPLADSAAAGKFSLISKKKCRIFEDSKCLRVLSRLSPRLLQFKIGLWCYGIPERVFSKFDNVFHVSLVKGMQKHAWNWISFDGHLSY